MTSPSDSITSNIAHADLSKRFVNSTTVIASPALAAETVVASITLTTAATIVTGIQVQGWLAFTVGTSGVSARLRIRQGSVAGATVCDTGLTTQVAANLTTLSVQGADAAAVLPNQVYVLTLIIGSGAAASTVSACQLTAIVV